MYGKTGEVCAEFWWEDLWERNHLEDLIEMDLKYVGWGGMDWVGLDHEWDRW